MSLRYILLGFLLENPRHGYGIKKDVERRLGHFRNYNEGQLYTELARLEKEGLLKREVEVPDKGPARKILHITPEGEKLFKEWLLSEQHETNGVLYDFMQGFPFFTKCSFFQHLSIDDIVDKIDQQRARVEKKRQAYQEIGANMKERNADFFRLRILQFGGQEMERRIQWLDELKKDLT